jgi:hypothetical protein
LSYGQNKNPHHAIGSATAPPRRQNHIFSAIDGMVSFRRLLVVKSHIVIEKQCHNPQGGRMYQETCADLNEQIIFI